ncbi:hypothetical protein GCM10022409_06830 [Hymenobacter glaciei]|uniref:Uncharacterized protein n=1 Tax=Hymenobacter glaciei TaxID=877209 RepID=A0ABP7TFB4_9BACT
MNSTDFHQLRTAPTVSRTTFFTELLAESSPRLQSEMFIDEVTSLDTIDLAPNVTVPTQSSDTRFPA